MNDIHTNILDRKYCPKCFCKDEENCTKECSCHIHTKVILEESIKEETKEETYKRSLKVSVRKIEKNEEDSEDELLNNVKRQSVINLDDNKFRREKKPFDEVESPTRKSPSIRKSTPNAYDKKISKRAQLAISLNKVEIINIRSNEVKDDDPI